MDISQEKLKCITDMVEEGYTVEIRCQDLRLGITRHPNEKEEIEFQPVLLNESMGTFLLIQAVRVGEDPVAIHQQKMPANYWISGIKGYNGVRK